MAKQVNNYDYYQEEKKRKKDEILTRVMACVMFIVMLAVGVCCAGFAARNDEGKWFKNWNLSTWHWADKADNPINKGDEPTDEDYSGLVVTVNPDSGLMTLAVDDNGATAESVTVKASINPPTAKDRKINFSLAFEREGHGDVSDYVALAVNGYNATVECLQAFSCPIILTAAIENTDLSATCRFDYIMPLKRTTSIFSTNSEVTSTPPASSKIKVGDNNERVNYIFSSSDDPTLFGSGTRAGVFHINYVEFWMHLAEGKISETESFAKLCDYLAANDLGSVTVADEISNRPKFVLNADCVTGETWISINYFDFFKFTKWSEASTSVESHQIRKYCYAALLEACPNGGTTMKIPVNINYSYVLGNKSFTYTDTPYVTFDFADLTSTTTDVTLNENEYVFGG